MDCCDRSMYDDEFDARVTFEGEAQPTILGYHFGPPTGQFIFDLDKHGIIITGQMSLTDTFLSLASGGLIDNLPLPEVFNDSTFVTLRLPFGNVLGDKLPPEVTASSGLDALTQLIEPFVSLKANPVTDAICREGMRYAARFLRRAYQNGADKEAREAMSLASLFGGLALANAGLGAAHGFAGPLGGMLHAPHGALCARFLPLVMDANLKAMKSRQPEHPAASDA